MLACVCQPADTGIFRRSPVPLGAPPLMRVHGGAVPKLPGRSVRLTPVITCEPKNEKTTPADEVDKRKELPEGVQLTLSELRDMACRQQAQIDSQHQLLAAKEQRLRYLKEQEARQQRVQAESERLRRLRDRVDAQELKLRKLRALRGQVDHQKQNNVSLTSDLDSIRALFNEKEKELSLAVAKVEELTRQLEELRRGRNAGRDQPPPASALELDKLRRELMYRNKLNEQQNFRLNQQREALTARQEEMSAIDKRISELQDRLHRKRLLNQQLANQISAASHKAVYHQLVRLSTGDQNNRKVNQGTRGNIVAVEPYNHVPLMKPQQPEIKTYHPVYQHQQHHHINKPNDSDQEPHDKPQPKQEDDSDILKEFTVTKSDPKYQTLPYNTKFTVNLIPNRTTANNENATEGQKESWGHVNGNAPSSQHMTVHSAPLTVVNKNIATPLNQTDLISRKDAKAQGVEKPVSSVAPTSIHHSSAKLYQTSSIKVQPVEPQTITPGHKQPPVVSSPPSQWPLSPPQSTSTPTGGTPETADEKAKPALPPKPSIKTPPRQTQAVSEGEEMLTTTSLLPQQNEPPDDKKPPKREDVPAIKAKPLTIKKQPFSEQPKLRSMVFAKTNGVVNNRRIEVPVHVPQTPIEPPPETTPPQDVVKPTDEPDRASEPEETVAETVVRRCKKGNLKTGKATLSRRVSFDPLALLLDASLEGELELVKKTATQVPNPSAANDEGITALHNAICAGHLEIVKFLVEFGCDVNAQDSDGWTPLHCAASCNNVAMVRFLVEHGACIFATTLSDHETAAEKCEEDEEGFDGCSEYLYSVQEKLGILSGGVVYAVFDYVAQQPDELSFKAGQQLTVLRKGDENEREWWWSRLGDKEGYVPRNLLGLYPRVCRSEE